MANTGHKWGAWAQLQLAADDWSADNLADAATATSDPFTGMDQKSAARLGFTFQEAGVGAISGDMDIWVLGEANSNNYEETTQGNPFKVSVTPVYNDIVYYSLPLDVTAYYKFKVAVKNNSGRVIAVSVQIQMADIPVAS